MTTPLIPHVCPECKGEEYYGRLARLGSGETCPNQHKDEDGLPRAVVLVPAVRP